MKYYFSFLIIFLIILGCNENQNIQTGQNQNLKKSSFYLGLVPTPKTIPKTTWDDIISAYEESGKIADISMVWTDAVGIGQYDNLKKSRIIEGLRVYGLKPFITLNFATIKKISGEGLRYQIIAPNGINADLSDPEFRKSWVQEAVKIAEEFHPEYLSLGNEINDYFFFNPQDLDDYISLVDDSYSKIKEVSPNTKILVVFSYNHLIDNNQWDFFTKFEKRVDLLGLTTYPWKHFNHPEEIPGSYYLRISNYTSKPIAFTEIGWPSYSTKISEEEQAEFLKRFPDLIRGLNVEMVNWLFLHEFKLNGTLKSISNPETSTISLKNADGSKKEVYKVWIGLK